MLQAWKSLPSAQRTILMVVAIVCSIILLMLAWYLASPLFINRTVHENLLPAGGEQATLLQHGTFGEIDTIHKGTGVAGLYRLPDNQIVLRLEEGFQVTNGPDLYVYLSQHPMPRDSAQLHEGAALEVAALKGNIGSQNYALPADVDIAQFKSVVVYCKRFSVVFSTAELTPP